MQHEGIGSRLIESFMREVCRLGCEAVTLEVSPANEIGMAFFAHYDFRKVHRLRNYYGKGLHGLLMAASCNRPPLDKSDPSDQ
jgi:ribosomal protein S18 acetylase RimI-like enzyme